MNYPVLIAVLLYELLLAVGVGLWLRYRYPQHPEQSGEFALAGQQLPWGVVAITLALTVLGAPHILGVFEMTWHMGAVTLWFGLAHVFLLVLVCLTTGRWVRRLGVTTVTEILERFFGKEVRLMVTCVMAGQMFGFMTLEAQGIGIVFATMTGWDIHLGAIVGVAVSVLYVIMAGMRQVALVNLVNAAVIYLGVILATLFVALKLPGGNYQSVADFYTHSDQVFMLSIYGTPALLVNFALSTIVAVVFCVGFSQVLLQPAMSAENEAAIKKSMWIAAPLNGMFCVFIVTLALTAKSIPEFQALGPKLAAPSLLLAYCPTWLSALLLASFLAAMLSNLALVTLSCGTLVSFDIYRHLYRPQATEQEVAQMTRLLMLVLPGLAVMVATFLPPILPALNWLFSWTIPVFWLAVFGFFWRRSARAAQLTLLTVWLANSLWSLTPLPQMLGLPDALHIYMTLGLTLAVGILSHLICKGEGAYFQSDEYRKLFGQRSATRQA